MLYVWLLSLNIMSACLVHVIVHGCNSFILMAAVFHIIIYTFINTFICTTIYFSIPLLLDI